MEELGNGEKNKKGTNNEELLRISISKSTDEGLVRMVERVNDGYEGGKVNRSQLANWLLHRAADSFSEAEIREIRSDHLDEFAFLEAFMRKAKKSGKMPTELRSFMNKQLGLDDATKKKPKKGLQEIVINDDIIIDDNGS